MPPLKLDARLAREPSPRGELPQAHEKSGAGSQPTPLQILQHAELGKQAAALGPNANNARQASPHEPRRQLGDLAALRIWRRRNRNVACRSAGAGSEKERL